MQLCGRLMRRVGSQTEMNGGSCGLICQIPERQRGDETTADAFLWLRQGSGRSFSAHLATMWRSAVCAHQNLLCEDK